MYSCAEIVDIKKDIKQNLGNDWIEAIIDTLIKIDEFCKSFNGKLMKKLPDYRMYDLSSEYLKQLGGDGG
jgi:hypothetical protein